MSIHVALTHRTAYHYDRPISLGAQVVRLRPAPHSRTPILSYSLKVTPSTHFLNWQQDPQGNFLARLVFPEKTTSFEVTVDLVADMAVINPFDFFLEPSAEQVPFDYDHALDKELAPFRDLGELTPRLKAWVDSVDLSTPIRTVDFLVALNMRLQQDISYVIRMEPGVQTPEETLEKATGSCRDSAWLLVQILRHLGFAARFVSGYLIQLTADQKALDGPSGPEADFTDLHAWTEVYLPGAGWVGLDPTSGLFAGEGHIPLAATPEPGSAAPIDGLLEKCEVEFSHHMEVSRVLETPRTTKPYTREQWKAIETLGHEIDQRLTAGDVRLTMGGEPTFVSIDDMNGEEWTTAALGPTKRLLAGRLLRRLTDSWTTGPLLHYGQGKWYPGESLPRWALGCWWRKDGEPIWKDQALLAGDESKGSLTFETSQAFAHALAERLRLDDRWLMPAYEDVWYYLWKEQRLPSNVDPHQSNLSNAEDRARLARVFDRGLQSPVGVVIPLQKSDSGWTSGPWFLRDERCYLIPGDSPMGYRLPLDSLPWVSEGDYPWHWERDPLEPRGKLPTHQQFRMLDPRTADAISHASPHATHALRSGQDQGRPSASRPRQYPNRQPAAQESASWIVRTAVCVEVRDGLLHVFMPPLTTCEDYLELVTALEDTARKIGQPIMLEGYKPPQDVRLKHFSVTPDPGVIEVNVCPSESWEELVSTTTTLYEEARQTRLGTEKFMIDGRHVGTGGGNHMVVGGATPTDSPFLRRPDLLRSLLAYWHNHPSLSYLFSGLFIGPTSQHPRVDEAREDATHELEIALAQIPQNTETPPWLIDRVLRHVLTDITGNTHRAEFCIDKLFSPDSSSGRLGLLELRGFEMPPHAEMSLAQQLLLRGLISTFWDHPYDRPLIRWGNVLHDRFMLPHFVWDDITDVLADLRDHGLPFENDWFKPHQEFRFPAIGSITTRTIDLELRTALEPWHVLGEEPAGGGTVRFVDSSVERMQVKVNNLVEGRYVVAVNGVRVPLQGTGTEGEFVAGVRYRAWQPPSCLHPTIRSHAPLVFDIVDTWNGRSLGGCTYNVAHPGGRNFETFPVNANEAESRRRARFFNIGHSIGPVPAPEEARNPDFPLTLDLRRAP
ncbi:transglutaminase family protein [Insolitispirillum peregrinum]|uniref:transglutaminase family protein n=1 Tax=Insolitispirillum peregrinum TaxID=80876 RepID=UPI00360D4621